MTRRGRLHGPDIACWLLKTSVPPDGLAPGWAPGQVRRLTRCVRRSYRLTLMAPGQPCLLWLSGQREPGVHAVGTLAGPAAPDPVGGTGSDRPAVEVLLRLLPDPVPRAELLTDPAFRGAEVIRMPAGSNPSYLDAAEAAAVLDRIGGTGQPVAG